MPRSAGESIPKYRKHRGSGQAVVTISGRDHYLGPHGTKASKLQYDRLVVEWLASGRSLGYGVFPDDLSIAELLVSFMRFSKDYYGTGPKSEHFHFRRIVRSVNELYGRTRAAEFGPLQFKAIRERFVSEGCSRSYVNALMQRMGRIFRWAAGEAMISPTVPAALSMVGGLRRGRTAALETDPVQPVSDEIVEATLAELPDVVADMVRLQRLTAARPAEICNLRPCDLDRTGDVWIFQPLRHKTQHHGKDRKIYIGPQGQAILLRYLARDAEVYCFRPVDSEARANESWSMDFMSDQLFDGRRFRLLTLVDNFTRESLAIRVGQRLTGDDVVAALEAVRKRRGTVPESIRVDNGPEFISKSLDWWAYFNKVTLDFSRPGKPTDNAYIESFNGRVRQECLNQHWFLNLADAAGKVKAWRIDYNQARPHSSLGGRTPQEFAASILSTSGKN